MTWKSSMPLREVCTAALMFRLVRQPRHSSLVARHCYCRCLQFPIRAYARAHVYKPLSHGMAACFTLTTASTRCPSITVSPLPYNCCPHLTQPALHCNALLPLASFRSVGTRGVRALPRPSFWPMLLSALAGLLCSKCQGTSIFSQECLRRLHPGASLTLCSSCSPGEASPPLLRPSWRHWYAQQPFTRLPQAGASPRS